MVKYAVGAVLALAVLHADGSALAQENEADDIVFPEGSAFGMVPFEGAEESILFTGFIDPSDNRSVSITEFDLEGWEQVVTGFSDPDNLATIGLSVKRSERLEIAGMPVVQMSGVQSFRGLAIPKCIMLVRGEASIGIFSAQMPSSEDPEDDACALIQNISTRNPPTLDDQLAGLPFAFSTMAGFRLVRTIGGSTALLTLLPDSEVADASQPILIAASSYAPTAIDEDFDKFGREALSGFAGHTIRGEPEVRRLEIDGLPGIEHTVDATSDGSQNPVRIVQWIAFQRDGHYTRLVGVASPADWDDALPRFQRVLDGLELSRTPLRD